MNFSEKYNKFGVETFYRNLASYRNPHVGTIQKLVKENCFQHKTILDVGAGGGEVTLALPDSKCTGVEPYISHIYRNNTKQLGSDCVEWTFNDIADYKLIGKWDAIICSFSLHLASKRNMTLIMWQFSLMSNNLYILSPTKQPIIDSAYWSESRSFKSNRVYFRHLVKHE